MRKIPLKLAPRLHSPGWITVGRDLTSRLIEELSSTDPGGRLALVADEKVMRLHGTRLARELRGAGFGIELLSFPAGEISKTRETKSTLEDGMLAAGFGRDCTVLALGGGVTIDLAGFVAATYMRGVPFIALPTTVLAMVDSSIGGKTGVDTAAGKNLIGAFHPPATVFADLSYLDTLPEEQIRLGMAEAIKHGLIASSDHLAYLEAHAREILSRDAAIMEQAVADSVAIKVRHVEADEREAGMRKALNYGHTFGHAMERLSGWSLPHGEAVARGLVAEGELSLRLGLLESEGLRRTRQVLSRFGLPVEPFAGLDPELVPTPDGRLVPEALIAATRGDKKARAGQAEWVLLARVGEVARDDSRGGAWSRHVDEALVRDLFFPHAVGT